MKRRKKDPTESLSESDLESNLKIVALLDENGKESDGTEGVKEEEDAVLDKSFISLDVEIERQLTFQDIENANV